MSTWKFDFTGRTEKVKIDGVSKDMKIEKQLTEVENIHTAQRYALVLARRLDTGHIYRLKIRYDLNPRDFKISDIQENKERCEDQYLGEMEVVQIVNDIKHGPALLDWYTKTQPESMPYPDKGVMDVYIMGFVPGENLDDIFEDLEWKHLRIIRAQLTYILETMRWHGRILQEQHPRFLNYDKKAQKLYFFDFSFCRELGLREHQMYPPITQDDNWVLGFNIWPEELLAEPSAPTINQGPPNTPATSQHGIQGGRLSVPPPIFPSQDAFPWGTSRRRDRVENMPRQRHPGSVFSPQVPSGISSNLQLDDDDDEKK